MGTGDTLLDKRLAAVRKGFRLGNVKFDMSDGVSFWVWEKNLLLVSSADQFPKYLYSFPPATENKP